MTADAQPAPANFVYFPAVICECGKTVGCIDLRDGKFWDNAKIARLSDPKKTIQFFDSQPEELAVTVSVAADSPPPPEATPNPPVTDEELRRWMEARSDTNQLFNGNILGTEIPPEADERLAQLERKVVVLTECEDRCLCVSPMPGQHQIRLTVETASMMIHQIQSWIWKAAGHPAMQWHQ